VSNSNLVGAEADEERSVIVPCLSWGSLDSLIAQAAGETNLNSNNPFSLPLRGSQQGSSVKLR
jgi:hypothetical protein